MANFGGGFALCLFAFALSAAVAVMTTSQQFRTQLVVFRVTGFIVPRVAALHV